MHLWLAKFKSFTIKAENWKSDSMLSSKLSQTKLKKAQKMFTAFLFDIHASEAW